jgi:myo-inositol-1(or 4)-monophosphatase
MTKDILEYTTRLTQKIGDQILESFKVSDLQATLKLDNTLVTDADIAADQQLRSSLKEAFPGDGIISEENNTVFPADKEFVWVIDPLDGTTNYALGLHYWGVSIARIKCGSPDLAVLYFPSLDELITATKGGGAFLNGVQLHVKGTHPYHQNPFFSCCSRTHRYYQIDSPYKTRILGSAAYGLCTVALGSAALAFEVTPKVWDFSGSWLVVQEAGGTILPLDGKTPYPLKPGKDYGSIQYPILAAVSQKEWDEAKVKIRRK